MPKINYESLDELEFAVERFESIPKKVRRPFDPKTRTKPTSKKSVNAVELLIAKRMPNRNDQQRLREAAGLAIKQLDQPLGCELIPVGGVGALSPRVAGRIYDNFYKDQDIDRPSLDFNAQVEDHIKTINDIHGEIWVRLGSFAIFGGSELTGNKKYVGATFVPSNGLDSLKIEDSGLLHALIPEENDYLLDQYDLKSRPHISLAACSTMQQALELAAKLNKGEPRMYGNNIQLMPALPVKTHHHVGSSTL